MKSPEVVVVDYGRGNLLSVCRALEHCGARVVLTSDAEIIMATPRLILPGVGAFPDGMAGLHSLGLSEAIGVAAKRGSNIMGICLGMQMLFSASQEFGVTAGLGLMLGQVVPIPKTNTAGSPQKIPHVGWNELVIPSERNGWDASPLQFIKPGESVYFVHSFMAEPFDSRLRLADSPYGGHMVSAAVGRENIWGCQFHPEKSGEVGLRVLKGFLNQ